MGHLRDPRERLLRTKFPSIKRALERLAYSVARISPADSAMQVAVVAGLGGETYPFRLTIAALEAEGLSNVRVERMERERYAGLVLIRADAPADVRALWVPDREAGFEPATQGSTG